MKNSALTISLLLMMGAIKTTNSMKKDSPQNSPRHKYSRMLPECQQINDMLVACLFFTPSCKKDICYFKGSVQVLKFSERSLHLISRAFVRSCIDQSIIHEVERCMNGEPFFWVVENKNDAEWADIRQELLTAGYVRRKKDLGSVEFVSLPEYMDPGENAQDLLIKEIKSMDDLEVWWQCMKIGFGLDEIDQQILQAHIAKNNTDNAYTFYVGYFDDNPVATCMTIEHTNYYFELNKDVTLHFMLMNERYIKSDVAKIFIEKILHDAARKGYKRAWFLSSPIMSNFLEGKKFFTSSNPVQVYQKARKRR